MVAVVVAAVLISAAIWLTLWRRAQRPRRGGTLRFVPFSFRDDDANQN